MGRRAKRKLNRQKRIEARAANIGSAALLSSDDISAKTVTGASEFFADTVGAASLYNTQTAVSHFANAGIDGQSIYTDFAESVNVGSAKVKNAASTAKSSAQQAAKKSAEDTAKKVTEDAAEHTAKTTAKAIGQEAAEGVAEGAAKKVGKSLLDKAVDMKIPQIALGVGVTAWLVNKLSDSRGQQSNAQLYGQQGY